MKRLTHLVFSNIKDDKKKIPVRLEGLATLISKVCNADKLKLGTIDGDAEVKPDSEILPFIDYIYHILERKYYRIVGSNILIEKKSEAEIKND